MRRDELRQPLRKRTLSERLWAKRPGGLAAASALALAGYLALGLWLARAPHPFAGEPVVIAAIPPAEDVQTASIAEDEAAPAEETEISGEPEEPVKITGYDEVNIIVSGRRALRQAPIDALVEITSQGQLPRIGPGGKRPSEAYARTTPMGVLNSGRPKIAILLGGMGLNAKLTQQAIADLPGDVSFAFAPYGKDLQHQVDKARAQGHEVMLQLPMEPVGYPAKNPGPRTLLADAGDDENREALHWHMSRFAGYVGITNFMGGRFLTVPKSLKPVLAEMKKRGLVFLEDATVPLSSTEAVAKATGLPSRRAHIVIDADPDPTSIAAALQQLETEAESNGIAIGTGAGLEVTIDAISEWAKQLEDKGILLVPVSAVYKGRMG
ncbi:MAG: divergent polysaccharide deacetylase family protein [Hyphomicrobiales bacterium]